MRYIRELRDRAAVPVLVTPLARNTWKSETMYNYLLAEHTAAMIAVGAEYDVPVVALPTNS